MSAGDEPISATPATDVSTLEGTVPVVMEHLPEPRVTPFSKDRSVEEHLPDQLVTTFGKDRSVEEYLPDQLVTTFGKDRSVEEHLPDQLVTPFGKDRSDEEHLPDQLVTPFVKDRSVEEHLQDQLVTPFGKDRSVEDHLPDQLVTTFGKDRSVEEHLPDQLVTPFGKDRSVEEHPPDQLVTPFGKDRNVEEDSPHLIDREEPSPHVSKMMKTPSFDCEDDSVQARIDPNILDEEFNSTGIFTESHLDSTSEDISLLEPPQTQERSILKSISIETVSRHLTAAGVENHHGLNVPFQPDLIPREALRLPPTSVEDQLENCESELKISGEEGMHIKNHKPMSFVHEAKDSVWENQGVEDELECFKLGDDNSDDAEPSDSSDSGLGSDLCLGPEELTEDPKPDFPLPSLEDLKPANFETPSVENEAQEELAVSDSETCCSGQPEVDIEPVPLPPIVLAPVPKKSNLKRKLDSPDEVPAKKRNISFQGVSVYYFPRSQGFTCVPSQGGSTLGMSPLHSHVREFSLQEHVVEQRRVHRLMAQRMRAARMQPRSDTDDSETDDDPTDEEEDEILVDSNYFLQPVSTRQRRAMLRASGIRKIDSIERDECRDIRSSREMCGCCCNGYCDPETCSCAQGGIKCQVDRLHFPCGCSRDGCANSSGRIEFNPVRVRTHFIHTLMRLELEKKKTQLEEEDERKSDFSDPLFDLTSDKPGSSHSGLAPFHFHPPTSGFHNYIDTSTKFQNHFSSFSFAPPQPLGGFPSYAPLYTHDITSKELGMSPYKSLLCDSFSSDTFPGYSTLRDGLRDQNHETTCSSTYTSLATVCSNSSRLEPFSELLQGRYPVLPLGITTEPDFEDPLAMGVGPTVEAPAAVDAHLPAEPPTVQQVVVQPVVRESQPDEDPPPPGAECDENLGVIIKQSLEETVSA